MYLGGFTRFWSAVRGDQPALIGYNERLTWAEVHSKASAIAGTLQRYGIGSGHRVGCMLDNGLDWCLVYYSVLMSGAAFVPVNSKFGTTEIAQILEDAECSALFSTPSMLACAPEQWSLGAQTTDDTGLRLASAYSREWISMAEIYAEPVPHTLEAPDDQRIAVIGYTSGTSGRPKGVVFTHDNIYNAVMGTVSACGWTFDDKFLVLAPLPFTGSYNSCLTPALLTGGCAQVERSPDVERALHLITCEGVSVMQAVPTLWQRMAALPDFIHADLSGLKTGLTGGAPVPRQLLEFYHQKGIIIRQGYGCSESSGSGFLSFPALAIEKPELCGLSLPGLQAEIRDDQDHIVGPSIVGELCLRGPQIMHGYWRKPEATHEVLKGGWLHTGDLAKMDQDGFVQIVDRKKNMVISGGVNIYPAEVERTMAGLLPTSELIVFGVPDKTWGERLIAVIHDDGAVDLGQLTAESRRLLGAYKSPREILYSPQPLPRTATGKLSRTGLVELYEMLCNSQFGAVRASR